jgi:DNA primase large subunit
LKKHNLGFEKLTETEMIDSKEELSYISTNQNDSFYKVDFRKTGSLMATHKTFLIGKKAYVNKNSLLKIASYEFGKHLENQLDIVNKAQTFFEGNEQISPMLKNFAENYCMDIIDHRKGFKKSSKEIDASEIEELYKTSFPLCMKKLHQGLKKKHHLTHGGRVKQKIFHFNKKKKKLIFLFE